MGRIRTIKPEFPQSESMGKVSRDARLLFVNLWTIVDDDGRTRAHEALLVGLLYPYDPDALGLIGAWLDELEREGCIVRYEVGGAHYLAIRKWGDHQKIDHKRPSKIPPPPEDSGEAREASDAVRDVLASGSREPRESLAPDQYQYQDRDRDGTSISTSPKAADDLLKSLGVDRTMRRKLVQAGATVSMIEPHKAKPVGVLVTVLRDKLADAGEERAKGDAVAAWLTQRTPDELAEIDVDAKRGYPADSIYQTNGKIRETRAWKNAVARAMAGQPAGGAA